MAYPKDFARLSVIGRLYDAEDFVFNINFTDPAGGGTTGDIPVGVFNALDGYFNTAGLVSSAARVTNVKFNLIGTDGRYVEPQTVQETPPFEIKGSSSSKPAPQVALAVTLTTAVARGRASKGRFYSPLPGFTLGVDGRLAANDALTTANQAWTLLTSLNEALDPWEATVMSNVGQGAAHVITGVRCGRVMDTIRSRRSSLDEGYVRWPQ